MLYARDSREFKCVQGICRLLGRPCDHSQRSGLLQTSKPPEKAADGNVPHVRRLQRFQNPYDDDARAHGTQVWSYGRTSEQPFCAQKSAISIALLEFNDLEHPVTPTFLFRNRFYLQLSTHCPKMNKKSMWEGNKNSRFLSSGH